MWTSIPDLLHLLEAELQFLDGGGYRNPQMWRPQSIFLDSPSCVHPAGFARPDACRNCMLMPFVPLALRNEPVPCHHIPLTGEGLTVDSLQRWGTQQELEATVRSWLNRNIVPLRRLQFPMRLSSPELRRADLLTERRSRFYSDRRR
jgi:hypothetical protein